MAQKGFFAASWALLNQTFSEYSKDNIPRLSAALSYYTVFSLAPLLVIVTAIAAFAVGQKAAQGDLNQMISGYVGPNGAQAIQSMVAAAHRTGSGVWATVIGAVVLLIGASTIFGELQSSLNVIWEVKPRADMSWGDLIRERAWSLLMVLCTGVLLLAALCLNAAAVFIGEFFAEMLPGSAIVWQAGDALISFGIITCVFALLFKYVPDAKISWKDVWIGAAFTGVLFTAGNFLLGLYLSRAGISSAYGAVGSLIVLLLWVYYVSQLVLIGAEFTQVYANTYGSMVKPDYYSEPEQPQGIEHPERPRDEQVRPEPRAGTATAERISQREISPPARAPGEVRK